MAKQDVAVSLFYDGTWHDVDTDVFTDEEIKVTRGQGDEGAAPRPSSATLTFDNRTDKYRPSNPNSVLYGKAGRNTPLRVQVDGDTRIVAEATSWTPDQTVDFDAAGSMGRAEVAVQANGILRRIGQWTEPLHSPFYRWNTQEYGPRILSYLPFEDPRGTLKPFEYNPDVELPMFGNMAFGSQERFAGSDPLVDPTGGYPLSGFRVFPPRGSVGPNDGWQMSFCMKNNSWPDGAHDMMLIEVDQPIGGQEIQYIISTRTPAPTLHLAAILIDFPTGSGTTLFTQDIDLSDIDTSAWMMFRLKVTASGGTVSAETSWYVNGVFYGVTNSFSGTTGRIIYAGRVTSPAVGNFDAFLSQVTLGHFLLLTTGADDLESDGRVQAFNGWAGETAADRFARLCDEAGIAYTILGDTSETQMMGPQRTVTFAEQLREIADTEDALIYDDRDAIGLVMQTRRYRYNRAAAMSLTWPDDIAPPFREVLDDLDLHNVVTVSNRDGGEYTKEMTTGPTGSAAPPNGAGEYRQTKDVNVNEETFTLPALAGWWLNRGTLNVSRYVSVTLDLDALPSLAAAASAVDVGDLLLVTGFRPDRIPLLVIGINEPIGSHRRMITFTTVPAELFQTGIYDNTTRRYDSRTSTLNASYNATATTMVVTFTDSRDAWSQTNEPYDWTVAGERITVTNMGAVTGSGPYTQSATVTRSVNGVSKLQASGNAVHMHPDQQARYAL